MKFLAWIAEMIRSLFSAEAAAMRSVTSFWRWFARNESSLFEFEKNQERLLRMLPYALQAVHRNLTFEMGPLKDGRREFVISGNGRRAAFAAVHALHAAAPDLPRWVFIKFRPPRSPINDLHYGGVAVRAQNVRYLLLQDEAPRRIGIMLFFPEYDASRERSLWSPVGRLLLDDALGEHAVVWKVGAVVCQSPASEHFARARSLADLRSDFEETFQHRFAAS